MMKQNKEKRTWRFTVLDVIILVLFVGIIAAAVWFFGPFRGEDDASRSVNIEYTIEIRAVEADYLGNIAVGDTVVDSVTKKTIGTVSAVESMPMIDYIINEEAGEIQQKEYPGRLSLLVTVSSPATQNERGYNIDGYRVAIGILHYLQLPNFIGSGYCIGVEAAN